MTAPRFFRLLLSHAFALAVLAPALAFAVPTQLNHQGRLLDSSGQPVHGELSVTFTLEDAAADGDVVWSETLEVSFTDGYFSVRLGARADNLIDADLLAAEPLWIGVAIDGGDPLLPLQPVVSAPYAVLSDSALNVEGGLVKASEVVVAGSTVIDTEGNWVGGGDFAGSDHTHGGTDAGVPLGTVIDWFRPSPEIAIPEGYQICDGAMIEDPESPWFGHSVPDLIGRFSFGVAEDDVGVEGGSAEHHHAFAPAAHDHSMSHDHGPVTGFVAQGGTPLTDPPSTLVTGAVGAVSTSGADNTIVTASGGGTTGAANSTTTGIGGDGLTSGPSVANSGTLAAALTSGSTNAISGPAAGNTGGSTSAQTSLGGGGTTGASSASSSGVSSGSTGGSNSNSTSAAGDHNHETFLWDQSLRRWKHYKSDGNQEVMIDFASNSGVVDNPVGEDLIPIGSYLSVGDKTSYTEHTGSHTHPNAHTHGAGSHTHPTSHTHAGPSHDHTNAHEHDLGSHTHIQQHQHQVTGHEHDIDHIHLGPSHSHDLAHDHDTSGHNHELVHSHTVASHDHDLSHEHDIADHLHAAGGLSTQTHSGTTGPASGAATQDSDPAGTLPPYVGLLKLMRIR